jgi:hypothetical protein
LQTTTKQAQSSSSLELFALQALSNVSYLVMTVFFNGMAFTTVPLQRANQELGLLLAHIQSAKEQSGGKK